MSMYFDERGDVKSTLFFHVGLLIIFVIAGGMVGCPQYNVWQKGLAGEAELRQAEWNRQIKVKEAQAALEAAKSYAAADIERAKGHAEANHILAKSLGGPEGYLRWLWLDTIPKIQQGQFFYIPTETGMPLNEAGRRK